MAVTKEVLQGFRKRGYSAGGDQPSARTLSLTSEELASIPKQDGEICLSVYGTLSDKGLSVSRVEPESSDSEEPDSTVEGPPERAMPSPS